MSEGIRVFAQASLGRARTTRRSRVISCARPEEGPDYPVELVGCFDVAEMPDVGHYDKRRGRDRGVEVFGGGQGCTQVLGPIHQQCRDVDEGQNGAQSSAHARAMARKPAG